MKIEELDPNMTDKPEVEISEGVDYLANHTAGGQIRFRSDCRKLVLKANLGISEFMPHMAPQPYVSDRPVIVYGTSITQGGCASRPGSCYTNILSRKLNRPLLNYGFSGNGQRCEEGNSLSDWMIRYRDIQKNTVEACRAAGDRNSYFLDGGDGRRSGGHDL